MKKLILLLFILFFFNTSMCMAGVVKEECNFVWNSVYFNIFQERDYLQVVQFLNKHPEIIEKHILYDERKCRYTIFYKIKECNEVCILDCTDN